MGRQSRYPAEVRERAVRLVFEHQALCYSVPSAGYFCSLAESTRKAA